MCDQLDPQKKLGLNNLNPRNDVKKQILHLGEKTRCFYRAAGVDPTHQQFWGLNIGKILQEVAREFGEKKGRSLVTPSISFSRPIVAGVFGMGWNRLECQQVVMYIIYFYLLLLKPSTMQQKEKP